MSATDQFEDQLLKLLFTNVTAANIGDATGIAGGTVGDVQVSLHTATLAETATLTTTSEAAYTSYARETVARSIAGWTVAGTAPTTVDNDAAITFTTATGGSETEIDFGLSLATTGNFLQITGALTSSLAVSNGITPEFAAGDLDISLN